MNKPSSRSHVLRNTLAIAAGILTFVLGIAWLVYSYLVDREAPYFAIPLVFSVPVIVTVAIRALCNDDTD
jgi:biotin transporter BioY